ncbi:hypothetical protein D3C75_1005270 [compost metagenome]
MPVSVSITIIQTGEAMSIPTLAGSDVHRNACNTEATFMITIRIRLDATPIISAGGANSSIVLARGWSMMNSL